ncbi:MAG: helix-turn-helix transcriptional regulator [Gemmatimonadota bacterium]
MTKRSFLGELEELVLLAALQLEGDAYGASILRVLDQHTGRDVPRGSVYAAIDRLESKGYLSLHAGEATPGRRGRPRRMVIVTQQGLDAIRLTHHVRDQLRAGLEARLQS